MIRQGEKTLQGEGSRRKASPGCTCSVEAQITVGSMFEDRLRILVREDELNRKAQIYLDEGTAYELYYALGYYLGK